MQRRDDTRVHQHHRRATRAEGEGGNENQGFSNSSYNNTTLGYGNATIASKYFDEQWVLCIVQTNISLEG